MRITIGIIFLIILQTTGCCSTSLRHYNVMPQRDVLQPGPVSPGREVVYKPNEKMVEEAGFIKENFKSEDNYIDAAKTIYWAEYRERDAVYQHIAIFDTLGNVLDSLPNLRGYQVYLEDLAGDGDKEMIVSHIEGNEMSSFPVTWSVYMLTTNNKLKKVLEYPKAYYFEDGSCKGCELVCFINRFHFKEKNHLSVETIYLAEYCYDDEDYFPYIDKSMSQDGMKHFYFNEAAVEYVVRE